MLIYRLSLCSEFIVNCPLLIEESMIYSSILCCVFPNLMKIYTGNPQTVLLKYSRIHFFFYPKFYLPDYDPIPYTFSLPFDSLVDGRLVSYFGIGYGCLFILFICS
jgi:hypothetical protein